MDKWSVWLTYLVEKVVRLNVVVLDLDHWLEDDDKVDGVDDGGDDEDEHLSVTLNQNRLCNVDTNELNVVYQNAVGLI